MRTNREGKSVFCLKKKCEYLMFLLIHLKIEADPDIMPRTNSFGLDYMGFVDLCPNDTPPTFLRLVFYCCIVSIFRS